MSMQIDKNQSLLTNAFEILMRNLGPQKVSQLWQVITPGGGDYSNERKTLFKGRSVSALYKQSKKFNRK